MSGYCRGVYQMRGAAQELLSCTHPEVIISGGAGTGKSVPSWARLHMLAQAYPRCRLLAVRKTRASLTESGLVTFEERILPPGHPVLESGGSRRMRQAYHYPNGSTIVLGGMDKPSKIMSTEYDLAYVQEATELEEKDWDAISSRLRNGRMPWHQIFGDTNPDSPTHWIKRREESGKLKILYSTHEDNPALYDGGNWTEAGIAYLARLDNLTGPRKDRLRWGRWVQAEGIVYPEYDPGIHLVHWRWLPPSWDRFWSIDFGYSNPFVAQLWARAPEGEVYRYREIYCTNRLVEDHARRLLQLLNEEVEHWSRKLNQPADYLKGVLKPRAIVCDHDAEGRATLERHLGMATTPADKRVRAGIENVKAALKPAEGKPRIYLMRDALVEQDQHLKDSGQPLSTEAEFDSYRWNPLKAEEPLKEHDHGLDALRYLCAHVWPIRGAWTTPSVAAAPPRKESDGAKIMPGREGMAGRNSPLFGR